MLILPVFVKNCGFQDDCCKDLALATLMNDIDQLLTQMVSELATRIGGLSVRIEELQCQI